MDLLSPPGAKMKLQANASIFDGWTSDQFIEHSNSQFQLLLFR